MSPRLWQHRITDILEAIEKIQRYVEGMTFDDFENDSKTVDAVIRNFIIIGEAVPMFLKRLWYGILLFPGV